MNITSGRKSSIESADSGRVRFASIRTLSNLFGAPLAWLAQLLFSEPLASHACYPGNMPVSEPIWHGLTGILASISLGCLVLALGSGISALIAWRKLERLPAGSGDGLAGTNDGLVRFLGKLGLMSSVIFSIGVIFNICALLLVSACSSWG